MRLCKLNCEFTTDIAYGEIAYTYYSASRNELDRYINEDRSREREKENVRLGRPGLSRDICGFYRCVNESGVDVENERRIE